MVSAINSVPGSPALIEPATWRDLNALRALEKVCFPKDAWPLWDLIGVLSMPNVVRLKAVMDDKMVGFIAGDVRPFKKEAWIATVGVLPEYQRQGIGSALVEACESLVKMPIMRLYVRMGNQVAIRLYQSTGYQQAGTWKSYYYDGEDALIMEKQLA